MLPMLRAWRPLRFSWLSPPELRASQDIEHVRERPGAVAFSSMQKLIECVPNFSEGRDLDIIRQITVAIESVDGIALLNVDPGASTNRTVITFAGSPEAAVEAAFRGIQKAAELIDMRKHKGAHPRMGATDVCPFIPVE